MERAPGSCQNFQPAGRDRVPLARPGASKIRSEFLARPADPAGAAGGSAWGKGAGKQFRGGVGEAAVGNEGTATVVKRTEGAISYNEWSFAQEQKLDMARIVTSAGPADGGMGGTKWASTSQPVPNISR